MQGFLKQSFNGILHRDVSHEQAQKMKEKNGYVHILDPSLETAKIAEQIGTILFLIFSSTLA